MLLNDFLYQRSLLKTEQHQSRLKFIALVPQKNIFDGVENPFEKEEFIEEIKKIIVKGGTKGEALEDNTKELEEENNELKEENKELEEENKELEEDNKELEEENKEGKEEEEEEEEWVSVDDEENTSESLEKIKKALSYLATKDGGDEKKSEDNSFEHKDVIFDNLSKEGGNQDEKDIKNVVVSFF